MQTEKEIRVEERKLARNVEWKDGELGYLHCLVAQYGDSNVGHDPRAVAAYLRLQASAAFRDELYALSACIGAAATAINEDARNDHMPDWKRASECLKKAHDIC